MTQTLTSRPHLNVGATAVALALTLAAINVVCALAIALWPDATFSFFNLFAHGLDLNSARSHETLNVIRVTGGTVGVASIGAVAGVIFAALYNSLR